MTWSPAAREAAKRARGRKGGVKPTMEFSGASKKFLKKYKKPGSNLEIKGGNYARVETFDKPKRK